MTKQQATAEMKYRLSIYILQVLLDSGDISTEEAIRAKNILLDRYDPFTRCLEEADVWQPSLSQREGDYLRMLWMNLRKSFLLQTTGTG